MRTTPATQGSITGRSFLGLVGALNRRRATGALRLTQDLSQGQIEKALYFERGEIYAAASNLPADSPLALLVRAGSLTETQAVEIEQQVTAGRDFREALIESGGVTAESLAALRLNHVANIFNSLCEGKSGSYQFFGGVRVAGGPLGCDTTTLLLSQARRTSVPEDFRRIAAEARRQIVRTERRTEAALRLTPREEYLLELIHSPLELDALRQTAALSEREIWQGLYALSCAGLIAFVPVLQAHTQWIPAEASAPPQSQSVTAERADTSPPEAEAVANTTPSYETESPPFYLHTGVALQAPAEVAETVAAAEPPSSSENEQERFRRLQAAREEVERVKARLASARDDYEVLGLGAGATPSQVRQSYRRLVAQYHPDRFQQYADAETIGELNGIVTVLRQAYETATEHAQLHAVLTTARARVSAFSGSGPKKGGANGATIHPLTPEEFATREPAILRLASARYREAVAAHQGGDRAEAIRLLNEAISLNPHDAIYQAHFAALLAQDQNQRCQAEAHLLRAVELEPQNISHRLQLGQLYRSLGLLPQAEQQLRLALKLNPHYQAAIVELRELAALKRPDPPPSTGGRRHGMKAPGLFARLFRRSYSA